MADRVAAVRLALKTDGFVAGAKTAQGALQDLGTKGLDFVGQKSQSINQASNMLGALGLAAVGMTTLAVAKFADFDAAMSSVQAATMESADNMELLRQAAIDAGADTQYSATEAAGAIEELAKAGVSTEAILGGGLTGALDLAASGAIDVAQAAEIAASAMTQFGLSGSDVTHIADLLAAGAGKAQGGVEDLGMALNQAGLVANQTGLSIEETVGGLAAFASAGMTGSDAGTSFKTMLQRLTPQSEEAAKEMERLGISAYDSQGQFIGLTEFAGVLQGAMKDLTPEARNAAMATIFGADAVRAASIVYEQGAEGVQKWITAVDDQGFAAEQAAIRMDNLKGDLEALSGSIDTVLIQSGSGANEVLRGLTQGAESFVDALGRIPAPVLSAMTLIAGGGGLVALAGAGFGKLVIGVHDAVTAMQDLGIASDKTAARAGRAVRAIGKIGGLGAVLYGVALGFDAITDSADKTAVGAEQALQALAGMEDLDVDSLFTDLGADYEDFAGALDYLLGSGFDAKMERFGSGLNNMFFGGQLSDQIKDARDQFASMDAALAGLVSGGNGQQAAQIFSDLATRAQEQGYSLEALESLFPGYNEALAGAENAQSGLAEGTAAATEEFVSQADAVGQLVDAQNELAGIVLSQRDAQRELEQAIADATAANEANGDTLDRSTQKGRENEAALDAIASSTWDVITAMQKNGADQSALQGVMQTSRDRFIGVATAMGMGADEANALADELGLIPKNVDPQVAVHTGDSVANTQAVRDAIEQVQSKTVTVTVGAQLTASFHAAQAAIASALSAGRRAAGGAGGEFSSGGYTGDGGKYEPAGIVHRGEFVVDKEKTAQFRPLLEGIQGGLFGYAQGGLVSAVPMASNPAPAAMSSQQVDVSAAAYFTDAQVARLEAAFRDGSRRAATSAIRTAQSRRAG